MKHRNWIRLGVGALVLSATASMADQLVIQPLTGNGRLQWNDLSTSFTKATNYAVEWASGPGATQVVWHTFTNVPANNPGGGYTAEVPMLFRLRAEVKAQFPQVRLAVFSDPHCMDPSLLVADGTAFQTYLAGDRKLLAESHAILEEVVTELVAAKPQIVLITGDLTKDGEFVSHQDVTNQLAQLKAAGAKVFVCPGNHDVNNPDAASYNGANATAVPSISAAQFAALYGAYGFNDALARDPNSLSYVAEPVPGLWILSMDSCRYDRNTNGIPYTGGYFDASRLNWITNQLAVAHAQGKYVLGMMHHGILEHYKGQKALFPDYVLDDYQAVSQLFASYGMKVVFTGHYHAQDAVKAAYSQGPILDIETGSTVTYPCPYRIMDLDAGGNLAITSHYITRINYDLGGVDFGTYATNFLQSGMLNLSAYMLMSPPYNLPQAQAQSLAPAMTEGFISHYQGDEGTRPVSAATQGTIAYLRSTGDPLSSMLADALTSVFTDLPPVDNDLTVNLITGDATP